MKTAEVRLIACAVISAAAVSCAKPRVVSQDGKRYDVETRESELFVYVPYRWRGLRYADAIELEKAFVKWGDDQGIFVYAMGRFPGNRDWQLGFVATAAPAAKSFEGRPISTRSLPAGQWASLHTVEKPDRLFFLWKRFKKWLDEDGYAVETPVFEVYPDIMAVGMGDDSARGEIRYKVSR